MEKITKAIKTRGSTVILRSAIAVIGLIVLAICAFALPPAWAASAEEFPSYSYVGYGVLTALYIAAIPFFIALVQAMKLLRYIDKNEAFSMSSVKALKIISHCGIAISVVFTAAIPFFYVWGDREDAPGLIVIGMFLIVAPITVSVFASVMQRLLSDVIRIKSENDLTV